jgi:4-carboxymuconolactone decarboxylase
MARIPPRDRREDVEPEKQHLYDEIIALRGELSGPTRYFMHSPEFAAIYSRLADYLRIKGRLNPGQVRLVSLVVAREFDCEFIWSLNQPQAAETGPSAPTVDAIGRRADLSALPGEEGVLARFISELVRTHHVSDATYAATKAALGEVGVLELSGTISLYSMIANMVNTFAVEPPGPGRFP